MVLERTVFEVAELREVVALLLPVERLVALPVERLVRLF